MIITINFDTTEVRTEADKAILLAIAGIANAQVEPVLKDAEKAAEPVAKAPATTTRRTTATKAKAPEPEPEPEEEEEEEEEENLLGGDEDAPTMEDAVREATKLLANNGQAKVKAALEAAGVKRVSELKGKDIPGFLEAIGA